MLPKPTDKKALRAAYGDLFDAVSAILFRHDPVGINFDENTDEYDTEAGTILPRLRQCTSAVGVRRAVHEEFIKWFDVETAGPEERYEAAAEDIWRAWQAAQSGTR